MSAMIFINNKYTTWYNKIVQQAQSRMPLLDTYTEKHHIIPRSLGGNNAKSNIVSITPREHFICHLLLTKMTTGNNLFKMKHAVSMLMNVKNIGSGRYIPSSRLYEYVKKCHLEAIKESWTEEKRKKHSKSLIEYNATVDKNSPTYIAKIEKIKQYQKSKVWSQKALDSRRNNCLKASAERKGLPWTDKMRQLRLNTYLEKNIDVALKIIQLYDTGLNKLQVSKQLGVSWEKVKYSILHRNDFLLYKDKNTVNTVCAN